MDDRCPDGYWNRGCIPLETDKEYLVGGTSRYPHTIPSFDIDIRLESKSLETKKVFWRDMASGEPGEYRNIKVDLYRYATSDGKDVVIGIEASADIDKDYTALEKAKAIARTNPEFRGENYFEHYLLDNDSGGAYAIPSEMRFYSSAGLAHRGIEWGTNEEYSYHEMTHLIDNDIYNDSDWDAAVKSDGGKYVSDYSMSSKSEDIADTTTALHGILYHKDEDELVYNYKEYFQRSLDYAYNRYDYLLKHWYGTNIGCVIAERSWLFEYMSDAVCIPESVCAGSNDVFRFYNAGTGVHFFTPSPGERDDIISKPEWGYKYEGVAYKAPTDTGTELYRFYNRDKGYHFLTASKAEADSLTGKPEWGYKYEGRSYRVTQQATSETPNEVHRFYNRGKGIHFYSASDAEANNIIANSLGSGFDLSNALKEDDLLPGGWGYIYEGTAWYVTDC